MIETQSRDGRQVIIEHRCVNYCARRSSTRGSVLSEIVNDRVASIGELNAWSRSNDSGSAYAFPRASSPIIRWIIRALSAELKLPSLEFRLTRS